MKILVVEDQIASGLALGWTLEQLGHEPRIVTSGTAAWDLLAAGDWRLVITDWMMPDLDGLDLCRRIRARHDAPYTYVILLTARDRHEDRLEGLATGADDFLTKPVNEEELAVRLAIACRILDVQIRMEELNGRLAEMATTDPLTGLANRRVLRESLETAVSLAKRPNSPCSVIMIDIDHFKVFNDTFGHPAGDAALRAVADALRSELRTSDLVVRYGGEEFVVLLLATDAAGALVAAERLRAAIATRISPSLPLTASFGIATAPLSKLDFGIEDLMDAADRALYFSKQSGRNRVTHHRDLEAQVVAPISRDSASSPLAT